MWVCDFHVIGNRLFSARKKMGLTQAEVAEKASLSDRTYADIERGTVNMRVETAIRICNVLQVAPNDLFSQEKMQEPTKEDFQGLLDRGTEEERKLAFSILKMLIH